MFEWLAQTGFIGIPLSTSWLFWGSVLLLVFPALIFGLGEVLHRLSPDSQLYATPVSQLRNWILPTLFVYILLRYVIGFDAQHLATRIAETGLWVFIINTSLAFVNILIFKASQSDGVGAKVPKLFLDLLRVFLVLLGAAFVISTVWNVNLGGLLTALGVGSVVIGLALQDTLGGLFSGLALISARQFKIGDWIRVGNLEGLVLSMDWRSLTLKHRDGDTIIIPNTVLAKEQVRNYLAATGSHVEIFHYELSFDHPPEMVKAVLVDTAVHTKGVITSPPPEARVIDYGDYAVKYEARIFVRSYAPVPIIRTEFQSLFWYKAQRAGLIFPARHHVFYPVPAHLRLPLYNKTSDVAALLQELGALPLPPESLTELAENARFVQFRAGERLICRGHAPTALFVIASGVAQASRARATEETVHVHGFEKGHVIAMKGLFQEAPSSVNITAKTDVSAVAVKINALRQFLDNNQIFAAKFEDLLSANEEALLRITKGNQDFGDTDKPDQDERVEILKDLFRVS